MKGTNSICSLKVSRELYLISLITLFTDLVYLLCTGGYYARLICSVTPVVQGSHPGVCRVLSTGYAPT